MALDFTLYLSKDGGQIEHNCRTVFLDVEVFGRRALVLGTPVHSNQNTEGRFRNDLEAPGLRTSLFDYFGEFYVILANSEHVEIISSSATHGLYFTDRGRHYTFSTSIESCLARKPKVRPEQCFLYVTQNINIDPFYTLYEGVNHIPGMSSAEITRGSVSVRPLPIPKTEQDPSSLLIEAIDDFGRRSNEILENPTFAVSGGIDGLVLALAAGVHSGSVHLVHGYVSERETEVIRQFSSRLTGLGINVTSSFFTDRSYGNHFKSFFKRIVKSNWIAGNYKLRKIDNGTRCWQQPTTIINGYGIDESYEWFRPLGVAYSSIDADSLLYNLDYLLSLAFYSAVKDTATLSDLLDAFETSKIYASNAAESFGLGATYNQAFLNRLSRIIKVASGEKHNYLSGGTEPTEALRIFCGLSAQERFLARHYLANSTHLTRFNNIFSNPAVNSSQPWEFMPFVKALANLGRGERSLFKPKKILFDYMKGEGLCYARMLKAAPKSARYRNSFLYKTTKATLKAGRSGARDRRQPTIHETEREMMVRLLNSCRSRPHWSPFFDERIRAYFDYLERSIINPNFGTFANIHELRNYVHLCHMTDI